MTSNEGTASRPAPAGPDRKGGEPPAPDRDRGGNRPAADEPPIDLDSAHERSS